MPWITRYQAVAEQLQQKWFAPRSLKTEAAGIIETLLKATDSLERQKTDLVRDKQNALREQERAIREAKKVAARIDVALAEINTDKKTGHGPGKGEKPHTIILSPYQGQQLLGGWHVRKTKNADDAVIHTYMGYPVLVCRGVYGPLVVTEQALAGLSRQAPELQMRAL